MNPHTTCVAELHLLTDCHDGCRTRIQCMKPLGHTGGHRETFGYVVVRWTGCTCPLCTSKDAAAEKRAVEAEEECAKLRSTREEGAEAMTPEQLRTLHTIRRRMALCDWHLRLTSEDAEILREWIAPMLDRALAESETKEPKPCS